MTATGKRCSRNVNEHDTASFFQTALDGLLLAAESRL
jgi:hypothetical protein